MMKIHSPAITIIAKYCVMIGLLLVLAACETSRQNSGVADVSRWKPGDTHVTSEYLTDSPEIWVISRHRTHTDTTSDPIAINGMTGSAGVDQPGDNDSTDNIDLPYPSCGQLYGSRLNQRRLIPMPLKHTDVSASIRAYIATVAVDQQFENPFDVKIEATYVFPLPDNAAVNEFIMTIGNRHIRGIIRERDEAKRIYDQARSQGYRASLLTQQRPNVFTQKVANIEPGRQIDIRIRYFQTLAYNDGWYEWVFPMVVGPRYNPIEYTDGIDATSRTTQNSLQSTAVRYLPPDERSSHDIALSLDLDPGVNIEQMQSVNHRIVTTDESVSHRTIALAPGRDNTLPNKDFVLRWRVAGEQIQTNLLATRASGKDGFFTLMLYPPRQLARLSRRPMEMIFVLDCSGSMNGKPIEQAKAAVIEGLQSLDPDDTFQIVRFSDKASSFGCEPLHATQSNIDRAIRYVRNLTGGGGTEMISGIKAALDFPHDDERLRYVTFLTDGYIGNDRQILTEIEKRIGESRLFSFGVGSSPNRFLLDRMAKLGRGTVAYLSLNDSGSDVMDQFFSRVSHPALTDLSIDWRSMHVDEFYPSQLPDLFVGRPVIITGRYSSSLPDRITIQGRANGRKVIMSVPLDTTDEARQCDTLPAVWARMKIADLHEQVAWKDRRSIRNEIRDVALRFGLMSEYTAFIAVDSAQRTDGDFGVSVPVAVPMPDGVRYDTTAKD